MIKTFVIWAVLIAAFTAFFSVASREPSVSEAMAVGGGLVAVLVTFVVVSSFVVRRQARRFIEETNAGIAALARGDLGRAREIFREWAENSSVPGAAALSRHNLGWILLRQGELQSAIDVLLDNDRSHRDTLKRISMAGTSAVDLALCYGLLGDVENAEKWRVEADKRANEPANASLPAMKVFARAVIACRAGKAEDAARNIDEHWTECEATFTGETLRPLRVVRAFAHAVAGPRSAGIADALLVTARPAYTGEYDFLGVAWPEMATFLAAHQLARPTNRNAQS